MPNHRSPKFDKLVKTLIKCGVQVGRTTHGFSFTPPVGSGIGYTTSHRSDAGYHNLRRHFNKLIN